MVNASYREVLDSQIILIQILYARNCKIISYACCEASLALSWDLNDAACISKLASGT